MRIPGLSRLTVRRLCTSAPGLDSFASGALSVKQRLQRTPLDRYTLQLIDELGVAMPPKGHRRLDERRARPRPRLNVLSKMGFVKAARSAGAAPPPKLAEIAFAGRSNVGKSSLLNVLSGTRGPVGMAVVANKPGVTRTLNFYANTLGAQLVDLPGYGFAYAAEEHLDQWQETMREYLAKRGDDAQLRVLLLIDARQSLKQSDRDFALWLDREARVPLHVVMSKCDLVRAEELAKRYTLLGEELRKLQLRNLIRPHHMISSKTMGGVDLLRATLASKMPDKLLARGRKEARPDTPAPSAEEEAETALYADLETPAARAFAEQLGARKALKAARAAASVPVKRGAEAARERAAQAMYGSAGRIAEERMASDFSARRIAQRRQAQRLLRQKRR